MLRTGKNLLSCDDCGADLTFKFFHYFLKGFMLCRPALRQSDQTVDESVSDLVTRALDFGVEVIVYRDLARDGLVMGADIVGASRIADLGAEVIVAGGVAGLDDIREAARAGLAGVIVGRALYDERFTLEEAIACSS